MSDEPLTVVSDRDGYTPRVGRLVAMMAYARSTTLQAVEGLTTAQLDHLHDAESNSIGALLHHIASVERFYQWSLEIEDPGFPSRGRAPGLVGRPPTGRQRGRSACAAAR